MLSRFRQAWNLEMSVLCLALLLAAVSAYPLGQSELPVALVFEGSRYVQLLEKASFTHGLVQLISCDAPSYCSSLENSVRTRAAMIVGQPKNVSLLGQLPNLRLVQSTSYMYPRLDSVPSQATVASYQPPWREVYGVEPIAEFVMAGMFEWNYRLRERSVAFSKCAWGDHAPFSCPPSEALTSHPTLMNQTIGILGYGKIGQAVARRSAALGMRTVATKVHGPFSPPPSPLTWLSNDNDRLLRESDFIITTLPGIIHDVINKTSLSLMKPGAVLIPVAAGPVDFDALYDALVRREIGGAIIDVWPHGCWHYPDMVCGPPYGSEAAPYVGHGAIQELNNVVALPGMAMRDEKFWAESAAWVASNLRAAVNGLPIKGVIRNGTEASITTTKHLGQAVLSV